jgi:superfamily II helicase
MYEIRNNITTKKKVRNPKSLKGRPKSFCSNGEVDRSKTKKSCTSIKTVNKRTFFDALLVKKVFKLSASSGIKFPTKNIRTTNFGMVVASSFNLGVIARVIPKSNKDTILVFVE